MRPGSVALLPVSTTSTGLLCLLVGAHVHRGRSDTEVSVWLLPRTYHILQGPSSITARNLVEVLFCIVLCLH